MSREAPERIADERTPLMYAGSEAGSESSPSSSSSTCYSTLSESSTPTAFSDLQIDWSTSLVLLLSVLLVSSDSAILLALFREIASDFNALSSASWIINSYVIGVIIAQPLYGKLSDIYGRKPLLLVAYICYAVGGLLSGIGFSYWGLILGRAIAGVGNAGITVLISTIIVDLVPIHEVAVWRGYIYTVNQIGRAFGPSLGGFIIGSVNWRWSLLYSVPLNVLILIFIWRNLPSPYSGKKFDYGNDFAESSRDKFRRIDLLGVTTLGLANCSILLFFDQAQRNLDILHNFFTIIPAGAWIIFLAAFVGIEAYWAQEPIFPLRLMIKRNVFSSYGIQFLQTAAQMALYTSVPLYFRVTQGDSTTIVSLRLLIITLGTMIGGLISGYAIKRGISYRLVIWISLVVSSASFLAIFLRWRGATSWLETLYGLPGGLGFGVSLSAAFIGLTAGVESSEVAVSISGFYLSLNLGSLFGVSIASLLIQAVVRSTLLKSLKDVPNREQIIHEVTSNIDNIDHLTGKIKVFVLQAYTSSLINVWLFAFMCGCLALFASFFMRKGRMNGRRTQTC